MRSRLVVAVSIIIYLVGVFNYAFTVSATALQDPDCCWILALGKHIWHERRLPNRDPFSYSIALAREGKGAFAGVPAADLPPDHFVAYQWLAETVFYGLYRVNQGLIGEKFDEVSPGDTGTFATRADRRMKAVYGRDKMRIANEGAPDMAACALTAFAALMVVAAFIIVPLFYSRQQATSVLAGLGLVLLATWAASFHFYLRPELFSYLFLSIIAGLAVRLRVPDGDAATGLDPVKLSLLAFCITALWTNLHVGFVLAPLILLATAAVLFLCRAEDANQKARAALCAGLAALAATALNPQGPAIWAYLPRLFFPSMNALIYELQPVGPGEILSQAFLPFTLFTGTAALILLVKVIFRLRHLAASRRILLVYSVLVIAVSLAVGFASRRLIPCSVLLVVWELFLIHALFKDSVSELFTRRRKMIAILSTVLVAIATAVFESSLFPPRIPQTSLGFLVPYDAMSFVESNGNLQGNLLNDPQFGDLMIWHLSKPPALFIDTRFDAYGNKIVRDYFEMANCFPGWQELLDRHRIAWVFLPPYARLSVELEKSPSWKLLFKDSAAVIFSRSEESSTPEE
ncbi:MAG: hypothetical protein KC777_24955 [Cyanobacteria bacterium HKST-UBA02]|nr:hypothetical protein [Cyanobacteria bacterium HKST-UBA02]